MSDEQKAPSVEGFIELLVHPTEQPEGCKPFENIYADDDSIQTKNLAQYLGTMLELKPTILLLGEAPGHRGCGKTGIAFTDEAHLYEKPSRSEYGKRIGAGENYSRLHEDQTIGLEKEASATAIWEALEEWTIPPLMWNVFPYHPHKDGNSKTNRTPTAKEVAFGKEYVAYLLRLFDIPEENVYCVGRTAQKARKAGDEKYIRHPSYGGKEECKKALAKLAIGVRNE